MYNANIRKWINKVEQDFNTLKNDYEIFEKQETEEMRNEVRKDISDLRKKLTIIMTQINDLVWWKKGEK